MVNLRALHLECHQTINYMPESISCLQKLEHLHIEKVTIRELPVGLAKLANLATLSLNAFEDFSFPPDLQVRYQELAARGNSLALNQNLVNCLWGS